MACFRKQKTPNTENTKEGLNYLDYKEHIRPLDLILFKGGDFISDIIRFLEKIKSRNIPESKAVYDITPDSFSHVGIVVSDEILDDQRLKPGELYIWESTMSGKLTDGVNNIQGKSYLGVQLRNLNDVIFAYDSSPCTRIAFSPIKESSMEIWEDKDSLKRKFTSIFTKYNGVRYDANLFSLSSSIFSCLRPLRDDIEEALNTGVWLFCSELLATVYQDLGLFSADVEPKNVVPMDFIGYDTDSVLSGGGIPVIVEKPIYVVAKKEN